MTPEPCSGCPLGAVCGRWQRRVTAEVREWCAAGDPDGMLARAAAAKSRQPEARPLPVGPQAVRRSGGCGGCGNKGPQTVRAIQQKVIEAKRITP